MNLKKEFDVDQVFYLNWKWFDIEVVKKNNWNARVQTLTQGHNLMQYHTHTHTHTTNRQENQTCIHNNHNQHVFITIESKTKQTRNLHVLN